MEGQDIIIEIPASAIPDSKEQQAQAREERRHALRVQLLLHKVCDLL